MIIGLSLLLTSSVAPRTDIRKNNLDIDEFS